MRRASSRRRGVSDAPSAMSAPLPEERPDRLRDPLAVVDRDGDEPLLALERLVEVLLELPRAVGGLHLPVAELVDARDELVAQEVHATLGVARAPVVAVG